MKEAIAIIAVCIALVVSGIFIGAHIANSATAGALQIANARGDVCIDEFASYKRETKSEMHKQLVTFASNYTVLRKGALVDAINAAVVDPVKEYQNLYEGEYPVK